MSDPTTSSPTGTAGPSTERSDRGSGASTPGSTLWRYARRGIGSGLFAGAAGAWNLLRVRRALRDGSADDAVRKSLMAVFWLGVAAIQWRSGGPDGDVDQTDVVDITPDVEAAASGTESGSTSDEDATTIEVTEANPAPENDEEISGDVDESDVVDTEPDLEDVEDEDEE